MEISFHQLSWSRFFKLPKCLRKRAKNTLPPAFVHVLTCTKCTIYMYFTQICNELNITGQNIHTCMYMYATVSFFNYSMSVTVCCRFTKCMLQMYVSENKLLTMLHVHVHLHKFCLEAS